MLSALSKTFGDRANNAKCVAFYLVGLFCNITCLALVKKSWLVQSVSLVQILFFRTVIALIVTAPTLIADTRTNQVKLTKFEVLLLISFCALFLSDIFLWNYGVRTIPLANVSLLSSFAPLVTTILAGLFLREKITKKIIIAITINIFAVFLVYKIAPMQLNAGYFLIIVDIVLSSFVIIILRRLSKIPLSLVFTCASLFVLPVVLFVFVTTEQSIFDINRSGMLLLVTISGGYVLERILMIKAYQGVSVVTIQPFRGFGVVFSAVLGYFILEEKLDIYQIIGIIIIFASTLATNLFLRDKDR